jgi:hypothetical protein
VLRSVQAEEPHLSYFIAKPVNYFSDYFVLVLLISPVCVGDTLYNTMDKAGRKVLP